MAVVAVTKKCANDARKEAYMKLCIDGLPIDAKPGQTLRELVIALGLDDQTLSGRPLAAKIAGEVFSLNYVPVRSLQNEQERPSIRRAMAASGGVVQLLRFHDLAGRDVYTRTVQFVLFLAIRNRWPKAEAKISSTFGSVLYVQVTGVEDFDFQELKEEIASIVSKDIPLIRQRLSTQEAIARYKALGQTDKARLLHYRTESYFDVYAYEDFIDYFYGELAPSTGYLQVWDVIPADNGFFFIYPDDDNPDRIGRYISMPQLMAVNKEGIRWCELMDCETVSDLNRLIETGKLRELVRVNEALHEKRYAQIADMVCQRGVRAVMLSGPSSSGKTTSANRLATQLRVHGKTPIIISLDDYYRNREDILPQPDGTVDLEHINTIDTDLFAKHLQALLSGEPVEIPVFNFKTGKREWKGRILQLSEKTVIIVEGLHALNPQLLPKGLDNSLVFKMYVCPLLPLNLDDHNRILSSYLRLLRRIVRDYENRGSSVEQTLSMWSSVRRGEKRWIQPFQESADVIFNSATLYELSVLKHHVFPLLTAVPPEESCYEQVRAIVKVLNYVLATDVDDEIPPTSLVREFIGGNTFYRE